MKLSAALAVLLIAAVALLAWTNFADAPWEDDGDSAVLVAPSPTPYQQQLTGAEAAVMLEFRYNDSRRTSQLGNCEALDFNTTTNEWIVRCSDLRLRGNEWTPVGSRTYRVADATGDYEIVQ